MENRKRPPLPLDASPQEKYDNLILTFFEEWQEFSGDLVSVYLTETIFDQISVFKGQKTPMASHLSVRKPKIFQDLSIEKAVNYLGFYTLSELLLVLSAIIENGLLEKPGNYNGTGEYYDFKQEDKNLTIPRWLKITYHGVNYCHSILKSGKNSTRCFVAMAFKEDMEPFYNEGIAKAIEDNNFRPIRIDKEHTENEQTINDFIIASIKQSKFCIADLTHQRNGVYFEAGYALGRGLKVIYTCRRDDHENVHFDLKTMQTILYDSPEELREALSLKIQAFILD